MGLEDPGVSCVQCCWSRLRCYVSEQSKILVKKELTFTDNRESLIIKKALTCLYGD